MHSWLAFSLQFFGEVMYTHGGRGKMWQLFGERMGTIIDELNEELTA